MATFKQRLEKQMKDNPEFADAYNKAKKQIDETDFAVNQLNDTLKRHQQKIDFRYSIGIDDKNNILYVYYFRAKKRDMKQLFDISRIGEFSIVFKKTKPIVITG